MIISTSHTTASIWVKYATYLRWGQRGQRGPPEGWCPRRAGGRGLRGRLRRGSQPEQGRRWPCRVPEPFSVEPDPPCVFHRPQPAGGTVVSGGVGGADPVTLLALFFFLPGAHYGAYTCFINLCVSICLFICTQEII